MRVAVIGAGGVGGFLGSLLAQAGHEVQFLARGEHLAAIRERGLDLRSRQFGDFTVRASATDSPADLHPADLVLVAVKMYDLASVLDAVQRALADGGRALTIQNGLDAPYDVARLVGPERVLIGTATIEATVLSPGVVGHLVPLHELTLSELQGPPTPRLTALTDELRGARINVSIEPDGYHALWRKAAPLIPFATVTTAASCGIGSLTDVPEAHALFGELLHEAIAVARACGDDARDSIQRYQDMVPSVARQAPSFTSSMNRDLLAGKRLELEWLTGKLLDLADQHSVAVPSHRALHAVIKLRLANRS